MLAVVMSSAEQHAVVDAGDAAVGPVVDVVRLAPGGGGVTAWPDAVLVAFQEACVQLRAPELPQEIRRYAGHRRPDDGDGNRRYPALPSWRDSSYMFEG